MAVRLSQILLICGTPVVLLLILGYPVANRIAITDENLNSSKRNKLPLPTFSGSEEDSTSNIDPATSNYHHPLSLDSNIMKRGNWQRKQIHDYCQKHDLTDSVPNTFEGHRFWLYDDEKKIVFCFVPKVGCSKWKYTFLLLNGKISFNDKLPDETGLLMANRLMRLSKIEREKRLADYYKYVFIRNPMERLVSGYLDKIAKPLDLKKKDEQERFKLDILKKLRHVTYVM